MNNFFLLLALIKINETIPRRRRGRRRGVDGGDEGGRDGGGGWKVTLKLTIRD